MKKQVVLVAVVLLAELVIAGCAQLGSIPHLFSESMPRLNPSPHTRVNPSPDLRENPLNSFQRKIPHLIPEKNVSPEFLNPSPHLRVNPSPRPSAQLGLIHHPIPEIFFM